MAKWLGAHSYVTRYRPIPIQEHIVAEDGLIYELNAGVRPDDGSLGKPTRRVEPSPHADYKDGVLNAVVALAAETMSSGYGALVFTNSRPGCERLALRISRAMPVPVDGEVVKKRRALVDEFMQLNVLFDTTLEQTIPYGVVYHRE